MDWIEKLDGGITVSDENDRIIYLNERAASTFQKQGGKELIGKDLMECHSGPSREKIDEIKKTLCKNVYTIEKNGQKKLIYQTPWVENGEFRGLVEISLVIPDEIPHFIRDEK